MQTQVQAALIPTDAEIQNQEIERLRVQASEVNDESRQFMEPEPPKKKRGRPAKARAKIDEAPERDAGGPSSAPQPDLGPPPEVLQAVSMVWKMTSGALVKMYNDDRMAFAPDEIDGLTMGWALVVHKYAPEMLNKYGAEIAAASATIMVCVRLRATGNAIIRERKAKMDAERGAQEKEVENQAVVLN